VVERKEQQAQLGQHVAIAHRKVVLEVRDIDPPVHVLMQVLLPGVERLRTDFQAHARDRGVLPGRHHGRKRVRWRRRWRTHAAHGGRLRLQLRLRGQHANVAAAAAAQPRQRAGRAMDGQALQARVRHRHCQRRRQRG
jgi:hypothetical protein